MPPAEAPSPLDTSHSVGPAAPGAVPGIGSGAASAVAGTPAPRRRPAAARPRGPARTAPRRAPAVVAAGRRAVHDAARVAAEPVAHEPRGAPGGARRDPADRVRDGLVGHGTTGSSSPPGRSTAPGSGTHSTAARAGSARPVRV